MFSHLERSKTRNIIEFHSIVKLAYNCYIPRTMSYNSTLTQLKTDGAPGPTKPHAEQSATQINGSNNCRSEQKQSENGNQLGYTLYT